MNADKHYEIAPDEFNADLYTGLMLSRLFRDRNFFDVLAYELFFCKEQELAIELNRVGREAIRAHPPTQCDNE